MMPLLDTHPIESAVLRGIALQTIDVDIMPLTRPLSEESKRFGHHIVATDRDIVRQWALERYPQDSKFLSLNRRVLFSKPTDVEDMIKFLDVNRDYGAVALNTKVIGKYSEPFIKGHVNVACMVIRRSVLEQIHFHATYGCECAGITHDVEEILKMKIGYLDDRFLDETTKI